MAGWPSPRARRFAFVGEHSAPTPPTDVLARRLTGVARWAIAAAIAMAFRSGVELLANRSICSATGHPGLELLAFLGFFVHGTSWLLAVVLFYVWLYKAHGNAMALGVRWTRFTPWSSVLLVAVPVVSFFFAYVALRDIWRSSDPESVPDVPRYRSIEAGYRDAARELIPPPRWRFPFPLAAWCGAALWIPGLQIPGMILAGAWGATLVFLAVAPAVTQACQLLAPPLMMLVMFSIHARQKEKLRRLVALSDAR